MRKTLMTGSVLLSAALALSGCVASKTGEVGNKNIRPYTANDYEKHGLSINGTHSFGSPTYRTRFANDLGNEQNRWMGRNGLGNNLVGVHDNYRLEMNGTVARQLERLPGVGKAYVMMAGHNAYVGVTGKRPTGVKAQSTAEASGSLKARIDQQVKRISPAVQNVYVTSNPEFINRMRVYSDSATAGHSVQQYLAEFNALVTRVFPAATHRGQTSGTANMPRSFGSYEMDRAYKPFAEFGTTR